MIEWFKHKTSFNVNECFELKFKKKVAGYGVYMILLELLGNSPDGKLKLDYDLLGARINGGADSALIKSVINDFGLFIIEDGFFSSSLINTSNESVSTISEKRRLAGIKSGEARKGKSSANVEQVLNKSSANVEQNRTDKIRLEKIREDNIIPPKSPLGGTADKKSLDLPPEFQTAVFGDAWTRWLKYRKEIRKKITESTAAGQVKKLMNLSQGKDSVAADIIQQSIDNGWQGLFPLKDQPSRSKGSVKDLMEDIDNILGGSDDNVNGV